MIGALWVKRLWPLALFGLAALLLAVSDPFGWHARRLERAQEEAGRGRLEARYRQDEQRAQADLVARQIEHQKQLKALSDITDRAAIQAREQADAKTALGDDRLLRLRQHDHSLCGQGAGLAGCRAATGAAR